MDDIIIMLRAIVRLTFYVFTIVLVLYSLMLGKANEKEKSFTSKNLI